MVKLSKLIKGNSKLCYALIVLVLINIIFIWTQSALSVEVSSDESKAVTDVVNSVQENHSFTDAEVRKIAHCIEFGLLGMLSALLAMILGAKLKHLFIVLDLCLIVALLDETIQIFSDRGDLISDIWIDTGGAVLGICIGYAIFRCTRKK